MGAKLFADSSVADGIAKDHEDIVAADGSAGVGSGEKPFFGFAMSPVRSQSFK